ncbi:MAG: radical SAM protein, partial [Desulfobacterales bacterium]|nr:radical SAM protein [Desulfobacterales bacterium]
MTEEKTLKTISDDALKRANEIKDDYIRFFNTYNVKYASGNLSKPYIGDLSPGCLTCINGTWSCIYINGLCTRNCFYCPQDRKIKKESPPLTDEHIKFNSADDYINYLRRYPYEGIGFSGGEPLLVFDKLMEYIKEIRKVFGSAHYVWIYTNGDLVNEERLNLLNKAGLDEIRFDASANGYDLKPIKMAVKHLKTVSIEIPAIPEDLEFVKSHIKEFEEIGVKHLNIHQLMMSKHNKDAFGKRNYSVLHTNMYEDDYPVLESELAGFEIIKHAIKIKTKLGINYCSRCYKARFQGKAFRKMYLSLNGDDPNTITSTGFVRVFSIDNPPDEISVLKNIS